MDLREIQKAQSEGTIDLEYVKVLMPFLQGAANIPDAQTRIAIQSVLTKLQIQQRPIQTESHRPLVAFDKMPGAEVRPGIVDLFYKTHGHTLANVTDPMELRQLETIDQIGAIVRAETQPVLGEFIARVWQTVKNALEKNMIIVPINNDTIPMPETANTFSLKENRFFGIPIDAAFAGKMRAQTAEQTKFLLRRAFNMMTKSITNIWMESVGKDPRIQRANALLAFRDMTFTGPVLNGFGSGFNDVIHPLDRLVQLFLDEKGAAGAALLKNPDFQKEISAKHLDFAKLYALFYLVTLGRIDNHMREAGSESTIARLNEHMSPDIFSPEAIRDPEHMGVYNYGKRYLKMRYSHTENAQEIPVIDFAMEDDCFTPEEIAYFSETNLRLGCPTLGDTHRSFTLSVCDMYFKTVLPLLLKEYGYE